MDPPLVPLVPVVVFHARLGRCFSHPGKNGIQVLYPSSVQDISQAGNQEGMAGARPSLVKHVFRVFDTLPKGQLRPMGRKFHFQLVLHFSIFCPWPRQVIFLDCAQPDAKEHEDARGGLLHREGLDTL